MDTPLYPRNTSPAFTPAEAPCNLELENTTLRMRVAVLSEALRAAEEELFILRLDAQSVSHLIPAHATLHGVFNKRKL